MDKVEALLHHIRIIVIALQLSRDKLRSYETVTAKFEGHFLPHMKVIFERVKFNRRIQEPKNTTEVFITNLHKLADTCNCGTLRDYRIWDHTIAELHDRHLSEKLQLDSKLMLQRATTAARASQVIKDNKENFVGATRQQSS